MKPNVLNTDLSGKVAVVTGAGGVLCSHFAKVLARCVSAPCNFYLNSKYVFDKKMSRTTFIRYIILAVFIMLVSALGVDGIMHWLKFPTAIIGLVGIVVDVVLYLVSYRVQNKWVFAPDKESK